MIKKLIKIIFLNYIVIMSESNVELLTNRIIRLELLLAYLIKDERGVTIPGPDRHNIINNIINNNNWVQAEKKISLDISYEQLKELGIKIKRRYYKPRRDGDESEDWSELNIYKYIEPEEYINNIYKIIEKKHNENNKAFKLYEETRVNNVIKEYNEHYKSYITYKKEQEKYKKEQEKYHEEELYKKALIQAKIQARIKAQEKLLEEEAMNELKNTTL